MRKSIVLPESYLDRVPCRPTSIVWTTDEEGIVTLEIKNTGWANRIAQKLFGRPRVSFIHLDRMGSFIWPLMDGDKTIIELGTVVDGHFGEDAHPLYERLVRYFQILESYHFIEWK